MKLKLELEFRKLMLAIVLAASSVAAAACDTTVDPGGARSEAEPAARAPGDEEITPDDVSALWLSAEAQGGAEVVVSAQFSRGRSMSGPRVAEHLVHLSPNLRFVGADPGAALDAADKELIAQVRGEGEVRLVMLSSTNMNTIETGELYRLKVEKLGTEPALVELVNESDQPLFAPADAAEGLRLEKAVRF